MTATIIMNFVEHTCINCGCTFYIPQTLDTMRREDQKSFYCYNGHSQSYSKSALSILQDKYNSDIANKDFSIRSRDRQINDLESKVRLLNKQLNPPAPHKRRAKRINA